MRIAFQVAWLAACATCSSARGQAIDAQPQSPITIGEPTAANDWKHEWTGTYYTWAPGHSGIEVAVESKKIRCQSYSCFDTDDTTYSRSITGCSDRVLSLAPSATAHSEWNGYLIDRIYLVRWGDRRYAVPDSQIADFVEQVRTRTKSVARVPEVRPPGDEPGNGGLIGNTNVGPRFPLIPVKRSDLMEPAFGRPDVPGPWAVFLDQEPIAARITKVEALPKVDPAGPLERPRYDATIDQGSESSVFVGQELFWRGLMGNVVSVNETSAVVRFEVPDAGVPTMIAAGQCPTTKDTVAALKPTSMWQGFLIERE